MALKLEIERLKTALRKQVFENSRLTSTSKLANNRSAEALEECENAKIELTRRTTEYNKLNEEFRKKREKFERKIMLQKKLIRQILA